MTHIEMIGGPCDGEMASVNPPTQHLFIPRPMSDSFVEYACSGISPRKRTRYLHRYSLRDHWSRALDDKVKVYQYAGVEANGEW